jgi:hypothetical protein
MLQTARSLHSSLAAFGATLVALHTKLIFALPRDWQPRELVFYALSHDFFKAGRTSVANQSSISMTDRTMIGHEPALTPQTKTLQQKCAKSVFDFCKKD